MPDKIVNHFVLADGSVAKYDANELAGDIEELANIRVGADGTTYASAGSAVRGQVSDLKSDLNDTQDWLGYPRNLFNYQFTTTNTQNWNISQTSNTVTITHLTEWSSGNPRTGALTLNEGTYHFTANYNGGTNLLALYKESSTWVKTLTCDDEITIESGDTYYIRSGVEPAQGESVTISDISITAIELTGKIPSLESAVNVLTPAVNVLQNSFNDITTPVISELEGVETQSSSIGSDGNLITAGTTNYRTVKYEITAGKTYWVTANTNWGNLLFAWYDESTKLVQKGDVSASGSADTIITNKEVTAPNGSAYLIITYNSTVGRGYASTQTGVSLGAKWKGKKWVCVGDSLTAENIRTTKHYFDYVSEETGITTVNMGVSGSGYARMADSNNAFYQRISSCPTDADIVTIFGSFNDLGAGLPIGTVNDTGTDTLAGCINTTITNLQTVIPLVNLGIVAPTPWATAVPATSGEDFNYVEMIKAICAKRSIPYLDLWRESNLRPWDADFRALAYSKDDGNGTHPDENGHKLIAPRFKGFLETLLM